MDRVIDISGCGCKVRSDTGRLVVETAEGERTFVPIRDVAVVMLSDAAVSVSGAVLAELAANGAVAVVCDSVHLPVGLFQPTDGHTLVTATLLRQIRSRPVVRARLWQSVVRAKVASQGRLLGELGRSDSEFASWAAAVSRGDRHNVEGTAAHEYWRRLDIIERRDRHADDANRMLNYAYAIIHSAAVRALCAVGLNTSLGLHHCGPTNPHCLASDMMEPFRVAADRAVASWLATHPNAYEMSRDCRRALVGGVLSSRWKTSLGRESFFAALSRMAVSLRECLCTNTVDLEIPELIESEAA